MTLYSKLTEALLSPSRGYEMERVLREAADSGGKPREALQVLEKMYDDAVKRNDDSDQNLICEIGDIARGYCRPEFRIWTVEETEADNGGLEGGSWG